MKAVTLAYSLPDYPVQNVLKLSDGTTLPAAAALPRQRPAARRPGLRRGRARGSAAARRKVPTEVGYAESGMAAGDEICPV